MTLPPCRGIVRYKPEQVVGRGRCRCGPWDVSRHTRYSVEMELGDLPAVADAACVDKFVLAGCDYWLEYEEGAPAALIQAGLRAKAAVARVLGKRQLGRSQEL
jgi:hypothetical protein